MLRKRIDSAYYQKLKAAIALVTHECNDYDLSELIMLMVSPKSTPRLLENLASEL